MYPENGIVFSSERNELFVHEKTWGKHIFIVLNGRCQSEKVPYSDASPVASWDRQGYEITRRISVAARDCGAEGYMKPREFFRL